MQTDKTERICALNDRLRRTGIGGQIVMTPGVAQYGTGFTLQALRLIAEASAFDASNDPHGEHDFGVVAIESHRLFWKIDYYDATMTFGADDPSDEQACRRVLTVMMAEEY